jgi:hypothetical protein
VKQEKKYYENPANRKHASEMTTKYFENPDNRKAASERVTKYYKDNPEAREKDRQGQIKRFEDPEQRRLSGLSHIGWKPSDETRKHMSESHMGDKNANYGKHPSEDTIKKISVGVSKYFEDPKHREESSIAAKERMKDQSIRDKISKSLIGKHPSEETRIKHSILMIGNTYSKGKTPSKETCKKLSVANSGENHYNWKGGISYLPYCPKFNKPLKQNVRNFFGDKCVLCERTKEENNNKDLAVHHVFTEKMACCENKIEEMESIRKRLPIGVARFGDDKFSEEEIMYIRMMVPLCTKCHGKQNNNSEKLPYEQTVYRKFFTELILNKYNGKCYSEEKKQ